MQSENTPITNIESEFGYTWFFVSVLGAFVPIFVRLIYGSDTYPYFDFKDFMYGSIAISLSNLNLIAHREYIKKKHVYTIIALTLAIIFTAGMTLGSMHLCESSPENIQNNIKQLTKFKVLGCIFAIISFIVSYLANKTLINTLNLNKLNEK